MQIYRLGEVNLCFTYLHGNVKAKVYPWVYEVFSNAIITPPHPSMPATHACPERTELRAVLPQCWASTSSLRCLPAWEGFEEQQGVTVPPLPGHCRAGAGVPSGPWAQQLQPRAPGKELSAGLHHCPPGQQQSHGQPKSDSPSQQEQNCQSVVGACSACFL